MRRRPPRKALRASPLAAFVTARLETTPSLKPRAASPETAAGGRRGNFSVWLPFELQRRARACAYWERITLSRLVEEALVEAIDRQERERGTPYEPAPEALPSGRPIGRR